MNRLPIIAGNWKMNSTLADAHILTRGVIHHAEHMDRIEIVLCPPSIWLAELAHEHISPRSLPHIKLGAQNMYFKDDGAFTGEISPVMVKEVAEYVIIGHSERTHLFHEDPETVRKKLQSAFAHTLTPILCIGEDKRAPQSKKNLVHHLNHLLAGLGQGEVDRLVLAYEPVWAIGTGNPATAEYAQEILETFRSIVTPATRLLYGGSVNAQVASDFLRQPDCDGLLVGGASLKLKEFMTICQHADDIYQTK